MKIMNDVYNSIIKIIICFRNQEKIIEEIKDSLEKRK